MDKTYARLHDNNKNASLKENRMLACIFFYFSVVQFKLPSSVRFTRHLTKSPRKPTCPILANFSECELWFRKRLIAFCWAQARSNAHDPQFTEYKSTEICDKQTVSDLGCTEFEDMFDRYKNAKDQDIVSMGGWGPRRQQSKP